MAADPDLVVSLESRLVNAWPAFEVELMDGWLLRFAEGYSRRANSATAIVRGARLDAPGLLDAMARSFAARGLPPTFRLTGLEDPGSDAVLAAAGYEQRVPSVTMIAALGDDLAPDSAVRIGAVTRSAWAREAAEAYGGEKANGDILGRIVLRIRQNAAFAALEFDGRNAGWGIAVAERGWVGLYDIVVVPELHGLGLGRRLVRTLLAWGRKAGAESAYLQMRQDNVVADALYRSAGFIPAYTYTHRILPEPTG